MKSFPFLSLCALLVVSSIPACEKIKNLASSYDRKAKPAPAASAAGPLVTEISESSYDAFPAQPGKVVIVDFYADDCGLCLQLAPILERIASDQRGKVLVGKVNVDKFSKLAIREGVRDLPDVRIYSDGRLVDKFVGLPAESEIRSRIETYASATKQFTQPMAKDWLPAGMKRR